MIPVVTSNNQDELPPSAVLLADQSSDGSY
jgi:hypothetical protein